MRYLKPHGALYNQAQREPDVARAVVEAARTMRLAAAGAARKRSRDRGSRSGRASTSRKASPTGVTAATARSCPEASQGPCCMSRTRSRSKSFAWCAEGRVATLCIHGDEPGAVANAALVRRVLNAAGIAVRSFVDGSG